MRRVVVGLLVICLALAVSAAVVGCGEETSSTTVSAGTPVSETPSSTSSPSTTATAGPVAPASIKVGFLTEVTGPIATMGKRVIWAWQTAIDDINADGGVYVKEYDAKIPIEVVTADLQADTANGDPQAQWLCDQGVVAILGSTAALPGAAGVAETRKIPVLMNATTSRQIYDKGYTYLFTCCGLMDTNSQVTVDLLNSLPQDQRPTLVASLEGQDVFSAESALYLDKALADAGYKVLPIPFTRHAIDLSAQILEMKKGNADFIVGALQPPDGLQLMKQMKQLDFNVKGMALSLCVQDVLAWSSQGADGDYVMGTANTDAGFTYPGAQELAERYTAVLNEPYFEAAGTGYACVQILANAIATAGTLDSTKIRDAIAATDMMTVAGPMKFNANGTSNHIDVMWQWQNGEPKVVWPSDAKNAELIYPMPSWSER